MYVVDSTSEARNVKVNGPGFGFSFDENDATQSTFIKHINNKAKYLANLGEEGSSRFWKEVINQLPKVMFYLFALIPSFGLLAFIMRIRIN